MYRCQLCGTVVPPRAPCRRVVVQAVVSRYPARLRAHRLVRWEKGKRKVIWVNDPGGAGTSIAREVCACPDCAAKVEPSSTPPS
jgi:hypothetical protein